MSYSWRRSRYSYRYPVSNYFGLDEEVKKMFLALDGQILNKLFLEYERKHGKAKRYYAERTYWKWKSGEVRMSGPIKERLLQLLPPLMPFDQKFSLVSNLWHRLQPIAIINIEVRPDTGVEVALKMIVDTIENRVELQIPEALKKRVEWLSGDDASAAESLLKTVIRRQGEIIRREARIQLQDILSRVQGADQVFMTGTKNVEVAGAKISISVRSTPLWRRIFMSSNSNDGKSEYGLSTNTGQRLPAQKPENLLAEALQSLNAAQRTRIIEKAAEEALQLQVKQANSDVDIEIARAKMNAITQQAKQLSTDRTIEFHAEAEHQGTKLEITKNNSMWITIAVILGVVVGLLILAR